MCSYILIITVKNTTELPGTPESASFKVEDFEIASVAQIWLTLNINSEFVSCKS